MFVSRFADVQVILKPAVSKKARGTHILRRAPPVVCSATRPVSPSWKLTVWYVAKPSRQGLRVLSAGNGGGGVGLILTREILPNPPALKRQRQRFPKAPPPHLSEMRRGSW